MNPSEKLMSIDNETGIEPKINKGIKNVEQVAKTNQALGMLKIIDSQIPDFDIDMTYDKKNDRFYFVSWNQKLNIPLDLNWIEEMWKIITKLLNNKNELWITWKVDFRRIFEVKLFWNARDSEVLYKWTKLDWNTLNTEKAIANNNTIEEIYRFTQIVKWIPKDKWVIEWSIWSPDEIGIK